MTIFQGRGRPQGDGDKTAISLKTSQFFKVEGARKATETKRQIVEF